MNHPCKVTVNRQRKGALNPFWKGGLKQVRCLNCGNVFLTKPDTTHRTNRKFCGTGCAAKYNIKSGPQHHQWKEKIHLTCLVCGKPFDRHISNAQKYKEHFCSPQCHGVWRRGRAKRNATGRTTANGYVMVQAPGHPAVNKRGYVYEHRLVAEKKIGRYLLPKEVVHHINENAKDNRPENITVFASNKDHLRYHIEHLGTPVGKHRVVPVRIMATNTGDARKEGL